MADFDAQGYFDRRYGTVADATGKIAALEAAKAQKLQGMEAFKQSRNASIAANEDSLVNQLGLDPQGFLGSVVNIGAAAVDGTGRILRNAATSLPTIGAAVQNYGIPDTAREAKSRMDGGIATPEDLLLLNQRTADQPSYLEQLQSVEKKTNRVRALNQILDTSSIVNKDNQNALTEALKTNAQPGLDQMKEGWKAFRASDAPGMPGGDVTVGTGDMLSGLAKALMTIPSAALNNPVAAMEFVSSNVPQLMAAATGATGMALTNVPYAIDAFREGVDAYQKANNGALPSQDWMEKNAAKAASLLLAETLGDKLTLGAGKGLGAITEPAKKALDKGVEKISREAFKTAIQGTGALIAPVVRTGAAIAEGGVGEFATEAYQTAVEDSIKGKDPTLEDAFVGGAIGAISGGTSSGGIAVAKEVGTGVLTAVGKALESKPVKTYVDTMPESKEIKTLFDANQADTTDGPTRATNLAKAQEVVGSMEKQVTVAKESMAVGATTSPAELADLEQTLGVVKEALAKADPADTARVDKLTTAATQLEATIAAADQSTLLTRKANLSGQERELKKAQMVLKTMTEQAGTLPKPVSTPLAEEEPKTPTAKAVKSIVLSMAAVEGLSSESATQMADDTTLELSDKQRTYLRKFSQARIAENAMRNNSKVLDEVINGRPGSDNISIVGYRSRIGAALAKGNEEAASKFLGLMGKFADDHAQKSALASELYAKFLEDGTTTQMVSDGQGNWFIPEFPFATREERKKNGALNIGGDSKNLVADIATGSAALNLNLEQQEAAYDMTFGGAPEAVMQEEIKTTQQLIDKAKAAIEPTPAKPAKAEKKETAKPAPVAPKKEANLDDVNAELDSLNEGDTSEGPTSVDAPRASTQGGTVEADTAVQAEVVDNIEPGTLDAFSKETVEAEKAKTDYLEMNLLSRYFKQSAGKAKSVTFRALASVKDFLSEWKAKTVTPELSMTPEGGKPVVLSAEQSKALSHFGKQAVKWLPKITANLSGKTQQKFAHADVMHFLLTQLPDGNGQTADMPENVKTAIAAVAYQYVVELAGGSGYNTDDAINKILKLRKGNKRFTDDQNRLRRAGTLEHLAQNSIGKAVLATLGISPKKDAPQNLVSRLESALGAHALKLLVDEKLLKVTTFSGTEWGQMTRNSKVDARAVVHFVGLARDAENKPVAEAEGMYQAQKGTQDILGRLFSIENRNPEPGFEPVPYVQTAPNKTSQAVPAKLAKILAKQNASANFLKLASWSVVKLLTPENTQAMMGYVESDETSVHVDQVMSVESKNAGLAKEYQTFMDYVKGTLTSSANGLKQAMYLSHVVWKNQRVGMEGIINPQTSKFHRFMLTRESWTSTVRLTGEGSEADMQSFMLRVAEGLGVKTENFQAEGAIAKFLSKMDSPELKAAVTALRKVVGKDAVTELSAEDQAAIVAGVAKGGEKMHSFDALMALAQYQEADKNGDKSFTTDLAGEIDGKTNGPMLSFLFLGAAFSPADLFKRINQGGFYSLADGVDQYSSWRSEGDNKDLYEGVSVTLVERLKQDLITLPEGDTGAYAPIFHFIGDLLNGSEQAIKDGRTLVKTPITALMFGSGLKRSVESMADSFLESIYKKIVDTAQEALNPEKAAGVPAKTLEIIQKLNMMVPDWINENRSITELMNMKFGEKAKTALINTFIDTMGEPITETLKAEFGTFIAIRNSVNKSGEIAFTVYKAAYQGLRKAYVDRLVKEGTIKVDAYGKPLYDLSKEQEAELRQEIVNTVPTVKTAMSKGDTNPKSGMLVGKERTAPNNDPTYRGSAKFGTPYKVQRSAGVKSNQDKPVSSVTTIGDGTSMETPGVATVSSQIHSSDSAISHLAAFLGEVLNVHDAHVTGLKNFTQTGKNLNQATWDTLLDYSPTREILNTLERTLIGVAEMLADASVSDAVKESLIAGLTEYAQSKSTKKNVVEVATLVSNALEEAARTAHDSDQVRLGTLAELGALDQYPTLGGQFVPTDADRAKAATRQAGLKDKLTASAEALAAVKVIESALAGETVATVKPAPVTDPATTVDPVVEAEEASENHEETVDPADAVATSQWGEVGKPRFVPDKDVVALFAGKDSMPAKEMARALYDLLERKHPGLKFHKMLLKAMGKVLPDGLKVQLVKPGTPKEAVLDVPDVPSRGWSVSNDKGSVLYFLNEEFVNSGMSLEVLVHELVHGALRDTIAAVKAGKGNPAAKALVKELERLLDAATRFVEKNKLQSKFGAAIANVDELVAWGMTNTDFMKTVLGKIKMKDKNKDNVFVTGAKAFYTAMSQFFFGGISPNAEKVMSSGFEVLLTNVTGLFAVAAGTTPGGSDPKSPVLSMAAQATSTYGTKDIFHALGVSGLSPISAAFSESLSELLDGIVFRLHGTFGSFKESLMKDQLISPQDVFAEAIKTGKAPFASQSLASGFRISEQEAFVIEQVEATVQAALDSGLEGNMGYAASGLRKLYEEAKRSLTVKDFHDGSWATATQAEQDNAQALYDFVFKVEVSNGAYSNYLSRFAALGMAHEGFNKLLKGKTLDKPAAPTSTTTVSIANRLGGIIQQIMQWFGEKMTRTYKGQAANSKLSTLVKQLVDIEGKRRYMLKQPVGTSVFDQLAEAGEKAGDAVRDKLDQFANSPFVQNSPSNLFKAGVTVARLVATHRTDQLLNAMSAMRDRYSSGQLGVVFGTIKDALGAPELFQKILRATKNLERARKHVSTQTSKVMLEGFANKGKDLDAKAKRALSNVILRTGAHVLLDHFDENGLHRLLSTPADLTKAIADWEAKLASYPKDVQKYYMNQSRALAYSLVWGEARGPNMMMNASNIASLFETGRSAKMTPAQVEQATKDLDVLITLYALSYSGAAEMRSVAATLATEMARTDKQGNGIITVMHGHKALEAEARDKLFSGSEALIAKGYTAEIFNPYTEVESAVDGSPEAQKLLDAGYSKGRPLKKDPQDPDKAVNHLYVRRGGGLSQHVTGAYSYTGQEAKGSTVHNGNTSVYNKAGKRNAINLATMKGKKRSEIDRMFTQDYDPLLDTDKHAAPVLNPMGEAVNYRYMMSSELKDLLLERENRFEVLMGAMAGSSFDKQTATEQNTVATQALYDLYKQDYSSHPEAYLDVGPNSSDPELREVYRLLPYETQQAIRRIWGSNTMKVRNDLLDLSFGYRKLGLADLWNKPESSRNQMEFALTWFAEHAVEVAARVAGKTPADAKQYAKRTQHIVQKSERVWLDLVREAKDIIVVKTGTVMLGNILSNISLLLLNGVSFADLVKHHQTATLSAKAWQQDSTELFKLQGELESGYSTQTPAELQGRIRRLEDSMARNPVKTLIDAGLMPSIVEDVSIEDSPYTHKAQLARKVESLTAGINPTVLNVGRQVYMTRDSVAYKTLSEITQLSDFVARYTLYTHLTTKKVDPLSSEAAIQRSSDAFVNYDIPMHRKLQYLDDMGLMMFMKYFIRIQRVIGTLMLEHPSRVISAVLMNQLIDLPSLVIESSMLNRIGNIPLSGGATQLPFLFDDLATVKAGLSLFK